MSDLAERVAEANRHYDEWRKGGAVDYMIRCEGRWHTAAINVWPALLAELERLRRYAPLGEAWLAWDAALGIADSSEHNPDRWRAVSDTWHSVQGAGAALVAAEQKGEGDEQ